MIHVRTRFQRADPEHVARLAEFSTATIHEAQGRLGALNSDIKPIDRSMSFCIHGSCCASAVNSRARARAPWRSR